eukprot:gene5099-5192_t
MADGNQGIQGASVVYVVRHGEREDHVNPGRALGAWLRSQGHELDLIFSSPLIRCVQTADHVVQGFGQPLQGTKCVRIERGCLESGPWIKNPLMGSGIYGSMQVPPPKPLLLQPEDLVCVSDHVDTEYRSSVEVTHTEDWQLQESPPFQQRCTMAAQAVPALPECAGKAVMLIGHGASTRGLMEGLGLSNPGDAASYTACTRVVRGPSGAWQVDGGMGVHCVQHLSGETGSSHGKL